MPKVKNTKYKVRIENLPKGFELIDGELVKKSHGGYVTGDQYNYGLTTFNPHAGESESTKDTDVRYSLSSVPRDMANIEAEGGETVLTDLNNDGQFGLYDIKGPRHSSGGVPMFLPEQSFIYSDTKDMKMGKEMLSEYGIKSRKKMTPAKVSKQYNLNKYYGILNDEYADKIQANTADLMLQKNKEGLSKLAFGQEMMKDFEDGVPLAAYPYIQSIGLDPFEFSAKVEGLKKFTGDQQASQMNPAATQAMNPMAAYGRELRKAQFGYEGVINALNKNVPGKAYFDELTQPMDYATTRDLYADTQMQDVYPTLGLTPYEQRMQELSTEIPVFQNQIPYYESPTVTRDKGSWGTRLQRGVSNVMESPGMDIFKEISRAGVAGAGVVNEIFKNTKRRQAEQDLLKSTMADNYMGISQDPIGSQGYYDTNTGLMMNNIKGDPSVGGGFAGYYGQANYGMELPKAQYGIPNYERMTTGKYGIPSVAEAKEGSYYLNPQTGQGYLFTNGKYQEYQKEVMGSDGEIQTRQNTDNFATPIPGGRSLGPNYKQYEELERLFTSGEDTWNKTIDRAYTTFVANAKAQGIPEDQIPDKEAMMSQFLDYQKNNYMIADLMPEEYRYATELDRGSGDKKNKNTQALFDKAKELYPDIYGGYNIDENATKLNQLFFQAVTIADKDNAEPYLSYTATGPSQDTNWEDDKTISKAEGFYGNNTLNQFLQVKEPITPPDAEDAPCDKCPDGSIPEKDENGVCLPCPEIEGPEVPDVGEEALPATKEPWIQDIIKAQAIADRERDMFLPWQPGVRRADMDVVLQDPTRGIAGLTSQAKAQAEAIGAFAGPQSTAARTAQTQAKLAENIADYTARVNAENVQNVNRAQAMKAQLESQANMLEDARAVKQYDDTMKTLQTYIDEKNFDREQYADSMANLITNMSNTYNVNQLYDYFNIDPLSGGDITRTGYSKQFSPSPQQDQWAFMNDYMEAAKRAKAAGLVDKQGNVDPSIVQAFATGSQMASDYTDPKEEAWKAQARQYMSGYQKRGGESKIKKWATPFYTGKMGT